MFACGSLCPGDVIDVIYDADAARKDRHGCMQGPIWVVLGEHSAIRLTFIKLSFVIKTFVLSIFKWPLKTGYTVYT